MLRAIAKRIVIWAGHLRRAARLGVRGVVSDGAGRVLLVRHTYLPGWYLPGGGVDAGETAAEAFAREVAEETGVRLAGPPRLIGLHLNLRAGRRDHVAFFVGEAEPGARLAGPSREIAALGFFALDVLPEGVTPATRRRLDEVFGAAVASREW